jgi:hypothetical protein
VFQKDFFVELPQGAMILYLHLQLPISQLIQLFLLPVPFFFAQPLNFVSLFSQLIVAQKTFQFHVEITSSSTSLFPLKIVSNKAIILSASLISVFG